MARSPHSTLVLRSALLIACLVLISWLVSVLLPSETQAYPFWPVSGVAAVLLLVWGPSMVPALLAGGVLAGLMLQSGEGLWGLGFALVVSVEAIVVALLIQRWIGPRPALRSGREIVLLLGLIVPVGAVLGALIYGLMLAVDGAAVMDHGQFVARQWLLYSLTRCLGDFLGLAVAIPLTLMLMPSMAELWTGRRFKILSSSILLLVVTQLVVINTVYFESQRLRSELDVLVAEVSFAIKNNIDRHGEAIDSIRRFLLSSNKVTADEFHTFTSTVFPRLPGLHALSWNPVVEASDRLDFESDQRKDPLLPNYQIMEASPAGLIRAGHRDRYVPVALIEPFEVNRRALGFDILSNEIRARAIREAERTQRRRATEPITLVQETGDQSGVLVLDPVFSKTNDLLGFAVGVVRLGDLLRDSFERFGLSLLDGTNVQLLQVNDGEIHGRPLAQLSAEPIWISPWQVSSSFELDGQSWSLVLSPSMAAIAARQSTLPQQMLIAGLLLVLFNQAFLLWATGQEQRERKQALVDQHMARHDALTALLNRQAFFSALEDIRMDVEQNQSQHVLLLFDLDHFKPVNDQAGHEAGDDVLRAVAQVIQQQLRRSDIFARIGGDEFAAILQHCSPAMGVQIAQRWIEELDLAFQWNHQTFPITASMGIRVVDGREQPVPSMKQLMHDADQACYDAKHQGRNRCVLFQRSGLEDGL